MFASPSTVVHQLGNGLTLLVTEEKSHPVASFQYWVGTGSSSEGKWLGSGLSHLIEHMVFKGTKSYSGQELACKVQEMGGLWNAYTSTTKTVYYIDGPSASWQEFLKYLTELVFFPVFPEKELEKEKEVVRREMAMYDDDPDSVAYNQLVSTLYCKHPLRWPVLGVPERFDRLTRDDIVQYHADRYCSNNVFLSVAGNVDAREVIALVEELTQSIIPGALASVPVPRESHQWGSRTARREFAIPYSKLGLAWRMPVRSHPDSPALAILARILGGGRSAWLYEKFHDKLGLVYDITAHINQSEQDEGIFVISADTDREHRDEVVRMIREEVIALTSADFDRDIVRILKQTKANLLRGLASASGLAEGVATQWFGTRNLNYTAEWLQALERVSTQDIRRAASEWFRPECLTEVSLDPIGSNASQESDAERDCSEEIVSRVLPGGLKVIVKPDRRLPLVNACFVVKAGSPTETAETAGICSLMAECLLKGTTSRDASQIAHDLENLGGCIHAASGNNSITIGASAMSEDLETVLDLLSDVAIHPVFPQDALEKERETMIAEVEEEMEDPLSVAFRRLRSEAYGDIGYGNSPSGTPESLESLKIEDIREHHRKLFTAGNAALCLSGDLDPEIAFALVERYFADLPPGGSSACMVSTPPQKTGEVVVSMDKEQSVVVLAVTGVDVMSAESPQAILFQSWCSDMAGPIFMRIREESGLAYYASSSLFIGLDTGNILFYAGTSKEKLQETRRLLEVTLQEIYNRGMSVEELERTRATALSARLLARQSNSALCQMLALDALFGLSPNHFEEQEERISAMTVDEMNLFIRERLDPGKPRTWAIVEN